MENTVLAILEQDMNSIIVHELKNHLTLIKGELQLLQREYPKLQEAKNWECIQEDLQSMNELLGDSKLFYQNLKSGFSYGNLLDPLEHVLREGFCWSNEKPFCLRINIADDVYEAADGYSFHAMAMKTVYMNLIKNSMEACEPKGCVLVEAKIREEKENKFLDIIIGNSGESFSQMELKQFFELDYTTKLSGLGLGLPLVKHILEEHGFSIFVNSSDHQTDFTISIALKED